MNPFRSPQFENSSKLLSKLETYHLHQTQLSNKPSSNKTIRSPKNQRINNVKRIEIISGTGDRRQKLYRKKGRRKLVLSEKAEKIRKPKSGKIARKHSDNWSKKQGRDLFHQKKEKNYGAFKKGGSGSPNLQKEISQRTNYSIGNQRFMLKRPFPRNKWTREDTLQSQYDISSEFIHSKENYNMYLNTKRTKAPVMSKMKKIVGLQSERSLLESMRMSRRGKRSEEPGKFVTHPMVFIKRKNKKKNTVPKKGNNSRNHSNIQKRKKVKKESRKNSGMGLTKVRLKSKSPKTISKKTGLKSKKLLNTTGNPTSKSSSRNLKKDYMMDVFVSLTHKKAQDQYEKNKNPGKFHFETVSKKDNFRRRSQREEKIGGRENSKKREGNSKQTILQNFLKKTDQVEKFIKHLDHAKKHEKQDLMVLITESSKETSQNISSKNESSLEKLTIENLVEKTNETRKLMEIFREQKSSIFENKRQTEDQVNSVFLKLLNLMEQERVRALKVVEDQFHVQKQNIFEIEKQLVLKDQNMQNTIR